MQTPLLLSCKITNAALKFLERRGDDLEPLYERFDWPLHYLRDPSAWLEAERLEQVLVALDEVFGAQVCHETGQTFMEAIGHESAQLRAWGALDSVLRIVPGLRELYQQPDRFLGSFISPQPLIREVSRESVSIEFLFQSESGLDLFDERFPFTAHYLRAAMESLPEFISRPRTRVQWHRGHVAIQWSEPQTELGTDGPKGAGPRLDERSLSPDLIDSIRHDLAQSQLELERARRALREQAVAMSELHRRLERSSEQSMPGLEVGDEAGKARELALHEVFKLGDYFARAQQIITLLRNSSVQSAAHSADSLIRRTSWEHVSEEAPRAIRRAATLLQQGKPDLLTTMNVQTTADVVAPTNWSGPTSRDRKRDRRPSLFDQNFETHQSTAEEKPHVLD